MYICDDTNCATWLHKDCLIDAALIKTHKEVIEGAEGPNGVAHSKKTKAVKKPYIGILSGKLIEEGEAPRPLMIEVTDIRSGKSRSTWQERVACPKCGVELTI